MRKILPLAAIAGATLALAACNNAETGQSAEGSGAEAEDAGMATKADLSTGGAMATAPADASGGGMTGTSGAAAGGAMSGSTGAAGSATGATGSATGANAASATPSGMAGQAHDGQ